eukprot:GSChrysophyteH1.ASY1.ANO1.1371.1 assembled CDS
MAGRKISDLRFAQPSMPMDPMDFDGESRKVPNAIYAKTYLQPVKVPKVVAWSSDALRILGVDTSQYTRESELEDDIAKYFSGNELIPESGCKPYAHCYCGHQFGSFAGQLGDGAAMYLGEVHESSHFDESREDNDWKTWELTLKGSGKTPFSRNSDGRKVLRSSIREFLGSEALNFLGVPTTRSGSCVTSSSVVQRDPFYDGRVIDEACSVITRMAPSFLRFGSFEIFKEKAGSSLRKELLDTVVKLFPNISGIADEKERYESYLKETTRLTAVLVARWNTFGFVHGVLNTDNMSVLGLTIDYGPYAFLDHFDSDFTPNGSDGGGRYTYENQVEMVKWNLIKLTEALEAEVPSGATIVEENFEHFYKKEYYRIFRGKLGLFSQREEDEELVSSYLATLQKCNTDFTDSFQALTIVNSSQSVLADLLVDRLAERSAPPNVMVSEMFGGAPLDAVYDEIAGEKSKLDRLLAEDRKLWESWIQKYLDRIAIEAIGLQRRVNMMRSHNPTFILRQWIAQDAINAAEIGDYSRVRAVLKMLETPFAPKFCTFGHRKSSEELSEAEKRYVTTPPSWAGGLLCTCSS